VDLSFDRRDSQGVVILDLKGRIVLGEETGLLREQILNLLAANQKKVLVNLLDVTRVDSAGIGTLVECVILVTKESGRLKLVNVPRLLHNSLVIHRLLPAFEIYKTEEEALASF
jgi:anti-anti-sigma factor